MNINGSIVDSKSNIPIVGADLTFKVGSKSIQLLKTETDGTFSFQLDESYVGKTLEYEAKKEGYQQLKAKTEITEDMGSLDLRLELSFEIPIWWGLKSRRAFFILGSISFFSILSLASLGIAPKVFNAVTLLLLAPTYVLVASIIIKGYLVPIVTILAGFVIFLIRVMALNEMEGGIINFITGIYFLIALISTFIARSKAPKPGIFKNSTKWLVLKWLLIIIIASFFMFILLGIFFFPKFI